MQLKVDNKLKQPKDKLHHQDHHHQTQQHQQQKYQQQNKQQPQTEQLKLKEKNLINYNKIPKVIMSEDVELMFNSGSIVFVETCYDNSIEGEVIAFDYNKKVLLLKCTTGNSGFNNVHLINLEYVKDVQIKKDVKNDENNSTLPVLNIQKVEERARNATDERKRITNAFTAGITEEGIKVFINLSKTVGNTSWSSKDIIVLQSVCISPPYKSQNCTPIGNVNERKSKEAVSYVKTLLDQYWSNKSAFTNDTNKNSTTNNKHDNNLNNIETNAIPPTTNSGQMKNSKQMNERTITSNAKNKS